jgi:hypothetical protein
MLITNPSACVPARNTALDREADAVNGDEVPEPPFQVLHYDHPPSIHANHARSALPVSMNRHLQQ